MLYLFDMPPEATKEWLALLERRARDRNVPHEIRPNIRYFHFRIGKDPAVVGKVRISERKKRDYEDEQGEKYIWHRYNRETEAIEENKNQDEDRDIVNITLDVWEKDEYDPNKSHFIFLTEELLINETHSQGDQRIGVEGDGQYSGPLAKYVDDWDALFDYAMNNKTSTQSGSQPQPDQDRIRICPDQSYRLSVITSASARDSSKIRMNDLIIAAHSQE
jgi:hypothetical protein